MTISTSQLRQALGVITAYLEETGRSEFEIEDDFYWIIPKEALFNPCEEPKELELEQLSHDLERLQKICNGENEPIGYSLTWLGNLLRAIGERTVG